MMKGKTRIADNPVQPPRRRGDGTLALPVFLLLVVMASTLSGCGVNQVAAARSAASPTSLPEMSSPSPTALPSATLTALPTVPAALTSGSGRATPTAADTATPVASASATATATPSPTATATATATPTPTPSPSATASSTSTPEPTPTAQFSPTPVPTAELTQDVIHILLIGGDRDYVLDMNTDTLIVVVVDRKTHQVSLLSIPRDLWVYIPTYGWGRINTAHRLGQRGKYPDGKGPGRLMRTIEENLGIPIDHWVRVGYSGFAGAVDELGGVDMIVPCRVNLRYRPPTSEDQAEMILEPALHHLDGETALRYVRTRRGDSDYERAGRQQQFLKAVWYQFKSPDILLKIPGLWSALKGSFRTDMKLGDVLALAPLVLDLEPQRIRSLAIGRSHVESWTTPGGARVLLPIPEKIEQVVARLYAPPVADDTLAHEAARIQVQNGTERPQLALIAADQLRWHGFQIVETGPADRSDYKRTQIIVFNDKPETLAAITRRLKVKPKNIIQQPDAGQPVDLLVILGQDYNPCR